MSANVSGPSVHLSDPRLRAVQTDVWATLARLPAPLAAAAAHLLDQITPPRWHIEWHLPQWLGDTYHLPPEATHTLVVANVFGLGYIRLQDDLADGEGGDEDRVIKVCLATAFYQHWIQQYVQCFPARSPFWQQYNQFMQQWLLATLESARQPARDFTAYGEDDYLRLAWRGAPLKICCVGAALLARRPVELGPLLAAVDHLLAAAVLLDHERDWPVDLEAGRYNTFVHYASPLPQIPQQQTANRRRVLERIVLEHATKPYFDLIQNQLHRSSANAQLAGCPEFVAHIQAFAAEVTDHQARLARNVSALLKEATGLLLGETYHH